MMTNNFIKPFLLIAFILNFINCLDAKEAPIISNNEIIFSTKKKVILKENDKYHIFEGKNRMVIISPEMKPNFLEYIIYFFDFSGKEIFHTDKIVGEYIFKYFDNKGLLLAGQCAMLIKANTSYLFDIDGKMVKEITHDYETKEIGVTNDEKYFWFVSNQMRPLKAGEKPLYQGFAFSPYNHILLFSTDTGNFVGQYESENANINIKIDQKEYILNFSKPDVPG